MNSPAVSRKVLQLVAGAVWTIVGLALCAMAVYWLISSQGSWILPLTIGLIAGTLVYYFGFMRLVRKNKVRINEQSRGSDKVCMFAFQSWRSYIIVVVMVALGSTLRHLPIPRMYLVPIYLAIGMGLFLASLHYYVDA